ncbi:MAG: hypothetical protein LBF22_00075 [Deltaproteobacteria bacterium]|jgi:ABC-type multidrug transport system fused ATPase/permease subunit|nr:hypothetical protein [Deltaproteobacteria bacterium]
MLRRNRGNLQTNWGFFIGLLFFSALCFTPELWAEDNYDPLPPVSQLELDGFEFFADTLGIDTSSAIVPGLAILARGIFTYVRSEDKDSLPWHAQLKFLLILSAILFLFFVKDWIPIEPLQKFLTALEEGSMALWGLIGYLFVIPGLQEALFPVVERTVHYLAPLIFTSTAYAQDGMSRVPELSGVSAILASVVGTIIYWVVWCVSNTINVLCLITPCFVAPLLKFIRVAVVGIILSLAEIHPMLGLIASLIVVLISFVMLRWSLRLTVWGVLFSFDMVFLRWRKSSIEKNTRFAKAFAGHSARRFFKIPKRTRGRLYLQNGSLFFAYRRFLFFKRTVHIPGPYVIGRTLISPILTLAEGDKYYEIFSFRLYYRRHEEYLVRLLNARSLEIVGVIKAKNKALNWFRGLFKREEVLA